MIKKGSDVKTIDNLELHCDEGYVNIFVNPKIYPIDVVHSASYVFMDRSFVVLDGDPKKKIIVKLRPRAKNKSLEELGRSFNDELLNYAVYNAQSEKNKTIKEAIVQKALFTNQGIDTDKYFSKTLSKENNYEAPLEFAREDSIETPSEEDSFEDDPLGIAKPWNESDEEKIESNSKEAVQEECACSDSTEKSSEDDSYVDDPLGIAKPWNESDKKNKTN